MAADLPLVDDITLRISGDVRFLCTVKLESHIVHILEPGILTVW